MNGEGKKIGKLCSSFSDSDSATHGIGDLFYPISKDTNNLLLNMKVLGFLAFY